MKSMGLITAVLSAFGAPSYSEIRQYNHPLGLNFSGRYAKKQNKLSQKGKRKRNRQRGSKK